MLPGKDSKNAGAESTHRHNQNFGTSQLLNSQFDLDENFYGSLLFGNECKAACIARIRAAV